MHPSVKVLLDSFFNIFLTVDKLSLKTIGDMVRASPDLFYPVVLLSSALLHNFRMDLFLLTELMKINNDNNKPDMTLNVAQFPD